MNYRLELSIEYANQRNYLDYLFSVYPTVPNGLRDIDNELRKWVETAFHNHDNETLIRNLLKLKKFPIDDSYVAYLRNDKSSISRNPQTINRLAWIVYELWLNRTFEKASEPKKASRQMWPAFRRWISQWSLGIIPVNLDIFCSSNENAILDAWDEGMKKFAYNNLWYNRNKGLDLLARFNGKYIIGEAKFLSDFWWTQNDQFEDAIKTLQSPVNQNVIKVAILDWVVYIPWATKMYKAILSSELQNENIMSALVLRDFLYQI